MVQRAFHVAYFGPDGSVQCEPFTQQEVNAGKVPEVHSPNTQWTNCYVDTDLKILVVQSGEHEPFGMSLSEAKHLSENGGNSTRSALIRAAIYPPGPVPV